MDHKEVEVAFATANEQVLIPVTLSKEGSVELAIKESGILDRFPEIDMAHIKVGIFGKPCSLEKKLEQGDRIEIYRPLFQNPMEARRNRIVK